MTNTEEEPPDESLRLFNLRLEFAHRILSGFFSDKNEINVLERIVREFHDNPDAFNSGYSIVKRHLHDYNHVQSIRERGVQNYLDRLEGEIYSSILDQEPLECMKEIINPLLSWHYIYSGLFDARDDGKYGKKRQIFKVCSDT